MKAAKQKYFPENKIDEIEMNLSVKALADACHMLHLSSATASQPTIQNFWNFESLKCTHT